MTKNKTAHAGQTAHGGGNGNYETGHPDINTIRTEPQESIPIHSTDGKNVVGHATGDTFTKPVKASKHMLRRPRGWAMDAGTLPELAALRVACIKITDTESGTTYTVSLATFEQYGVPFNRGYGPQVVLPLGYWRVDGKPPRLGQPSQPAPDAPRQLSLFADVG